MRKRILLSAGIVVILSLAWLKLSSAQWSDIIHQYVVMHEGRMGGLEGATVIIMDENNGVRDTGITTPHQFSNTRYDSNYLGDTVTAAKNGYYIKTVPVARDSTNTSIWLTPITPTTPRMPPEMLRE